MSGCDETVEDDLEVHKIIVDAKRWFWYNLGMELSTNIPEGTPVNVDLWGNPDSITAIPLQSPFNYTGSKSNLVDRLRPMFPSGIKTVCDLFCGGGGFFVNVRDDFPHIIANDIITPLVDFYKWLQTHKWDYVMAMIWDAIHSANIRDGDRES